MFDSSAREDPIKIVLYGERPQTLNWWLRSKYKTHGAAQAGQAERARKKKVIADTISVHLMVLKTKGLLKRFSSQVTIEFTVYFDQRSYDPDNLHPKPYIDQVKHDLLMDDSARYVDSVILRSRIDKQFPRVEIVLTPIESAPVASRRLPRKGDGKTGLEQAIGKLGKSGKTAIPGLHQPSPAARR